MRRRACSTAPAASARRPSASRCAATTCSRPTSRPRRSSARGREAAAHGRGARVSASPTSRACPSRSRGRSRACSSCDNSVAHLHSDEDLARFAAGVAAKLRARRPRGRQPARLRARSWAERARRASRARRAGHDLVPDLGLGRRRPQLRARAVHAARRGRELADDLPPHAPARAAARRAVRRARRRRPGRGALAHARRDRLLPADRDCAASAEARRLPSGACASRRSPTASPATTRRPGTSIASRRSGGRAATTSSCSRSAIPTSRRRRSSSRPRTPRCAPVARTTRTRRASWRCVRRSRSARPCWAGRPVDASRVVFFPGAQAAMFSVCVSVLGEGDEVIVPEPFYATYPGIFATAGATTVQRAAAPRARVPARRRRGRGRAHASARARSS